MSNFVLTGGTLLLAGMGGFVALDDTHPFIAYVIFAGTIWGFVLLKRQLLPTLAGMEDRDFSGVRAASSDEEGISSDDH